MTDTVETTQLKAGVSYERKVGLPNYGNVSANAWLAVDITDAEDDAEIVKRIHNAFTSVKLAVLDELGIESTFEGGVVVEADVEPAVTLKRNEKTNHARVTPEEVGERLVEKATNLIEGAFPGSVRETSFDVKDQKGPLPGWAVKAISESGVRAVYDNRKSETQGPGYSSNGKELPWFKEVAPRGERGQAFWPPR